MWTYGRFKLLSYMAHLSTYLKSKTIYYGIFKEETMYTAYL